MKFTKNILIIFLTIFSLNANAVDHRLSYYEDEGDLLFKIRGFVAHSQGALSKAFVGNTEIFENDNSLGNYGGGVDGSITCFFTRHFAAELSAGLGLIRTNEETLKQALREDGKDTIANNDNRVYHIPVSGILQWHIAPYGALRPHFGIGYHGSIMHSRSNLFSVSHGHGVVGQLGLDIVLNDDTMFTINARQFFLKSNIKFHAATAIKEGQEKEKEAKDIETTATWNPTAILVGIGFKL